MRGIVPEVILNRKDKIGFASPEKQWFTALRTWVQEVLTGETANQLPMLNNSKIKKEFIQATSGRKSFHPSLWRCVNFIIWAEQFNIL
jgi:asparagine synthase (glutamine-hydrolysing)